MLGLHNVDEGRAKAQGELVRVLRPGGTIVVSGLAATSDWAKYFEALGLVIDHGGTEWGSFPFQRAVVAKGAG